MTRVANKKRPLRSGQWLSWSLRTGWRVVSTTIFEWLFNLWLKMWMNYCVIVVDNLHMKGKLSIEAPSVTCFGLVTYRVQGWQLETRCPLCIKKLNSKLKLFSYRCTLNCSKNVSGGRHIVWKQLLPDNDIPSGISLPEVFSWNPIFLAQNSILFQRLSNFRETFFNGFQFPRNLLQWLSTFFYIVKILMSWIFWFSALSFLILA